MEQVVQDNQFPSLKKLKLRERSATPDEAYKNYMKDLVSRAPRLQELQTDVPIIAMLHAIEESSVVIRYQHLAHAPFNEIPETAIGKLRLEKMRMLSVPRDFDFERFYRITPMLFRGSCTATLREIQVDAVLAVPLMCYGVRLEKVKDLDMVIDYYKLNLFEPWILRIVKGFDFTRIFPSLARVKISNEIFRGLSQDHKNQIIAQANAILKCPMPDRAANVKDLYFQRWNLYNDSAQFFAAMFPNIQKLDLTATDGLCIPFGSIWEHWVDLQEFRVEGELTDGRTSNLDSKFCGIFEEEIKELRLKDEDYLKRVNIVPVMPAMTCLRNLRALTITHNHCSGSYPYDGTFIFSKVTALIAFARFPALAVSLNISSCTSIPDLTYLDPYVTVKSFGQ